MSHYMVFDTGLAIVAKYAPQGLAAPMGTLVNPWPLSRIPRGQTLNAGVLMPHVYPPTKWDRDYADNVRRHLRGMEAL